MDNKPSQEKRLDFLVERFKADIPEYRRVRIPTDAEGKRRMLRSLMNVRDPKPAAAAVLAVQDAYLKGRALEKGIVNVSDMATVKESLGSAHPFADIISIWQGDITRIAADAIVNAANPVMLGCYIPLHNCIDNCIHTYAGIQLRAECDRKMNSLRLRFGEHYEQPAAVPILTEAYNLPAKKVIHIVGPIVQDDLTPGAERKLAACYSSIMDMCRENGLRSVAFCCISTGEYNFPGRRAAEIAVKTVTESLRDDSGSFDRVIFNVFRDEDREYYEELMSQTC